MRSAKVVLLEAVLVALAGLIFALAANALSPRGLRLSRNYFPGDGKSASPTRDAVGEAFRGTNEAVRTPTNLLEATFRRLQQRGLQPITSNDIVAAFRDVTYEQGLTVFIDARDDQHYQAGHIPGAWQFNHYRAEQFLPSVLPVCMNAQKVVVYCAGGTCEDSEFAALMLRNGGVAPTNLFVYAGGITEWMTNRLPVEIGARRSGQFLRP
jgi:rhodanese-related sulfurtransferase